MEDQAPTAPPRRPLTPVPRDAPDRYAQLARQCARVAWENRATEIVLLQVGDLCSYADYFVLATGHNRNHLRAVAHDAEAAMGASGVTLLGREGVDTGGWLLLDFGEVLLQLFEREARGFYQLEELWADAPRLDWEVSA